MRSLIPLAILILAQVGAAWAVGDPNIARPGGAFSTVAAADAAACERLCAGDALCMAWSYSDALCELKAVVPPPVAQPGFVSGIAARAPVSMRVVQQRPPPVPASNNAETEATTEAGSEAKTEAGPAAPPSEDAVSLALLGGPEAEEDLRARLENEGYR